jgi:hypothetical protein
MSITLSVDLKDPQFVSRVEEAIEDAIDERIETMAEKDGWVEPTYSSDITVLEY